MRQVATILWERRVEEEKKGRKKVSSREKKETRERRVEREGENRKRDEPSSSLDLRLEHVTFSWHVDLSSKFGYLSQRRDRLHERIES